MSLTCTKQISDKHGEKLLWSSSAGHVQMLVNNKELRLPLEVWCRCRCLLHGPSAPSAHVEKHLAEAAHHWTSEAAMGHPWDIHVTSMGHPMIYSTSWFSAFKRKSVLSLFIIQNQPFLYIMGCPIDVPWTAAQAVPQLRNNYETTMGQLEDN